MTVLKLTKSGKAIQVVDDDGRVYVTSVNSLVMLMNGNAKPGFLMMKRLPFNVSPDRFEQSPVYDPDGVFEKEGTEKSLNTGNDMFSKKGREQSEQKKAYTDKSVW